MALRSSPETKVYYNTTISSTKTYVGLAGDSGTLVAAANEIMHVQDPGEQSEQANIQERIDFGQRYAQYTIGAQSISSLSLVVAYDEHNANHAELRAMKPGAKLELGFHSIDGTEGELDYTLAEFVGFSKVYSTGDAAMVTLTFQPTGGWLYFTSS